MHARLARFLATTADDELRDGERAVHLAEHATEMTGGQVSPVLDTLGTAYAAAGRFDDAVRAASAAGTLATGSGDTALAGEIEQRLALYQAGEPFRVQRAE